MRQANRDGFTINLSANDLQDADQLADLNVAPVTTVLPAGVTKNAVTPKGRKVIICPARTTRGMDCAKCGICAKQRQAIIGFPALGKGADRIH